MRSLSLPGIPVEIYGLLFMAIVILSAISGIVIFKKYAKSQAGQHSNEMAGIIFGTLSLIYSLLIAFVIIAAWQDYEELRQTIDKEVDNLNSIEIHSKVIPDSLAHTIQTGLRQYCIDIMDREWNYKGERTIYPNKFLSSLRYVMLRNSPKDKLQENLWNILDDHLTKLSDLRRQRLSHIRSHIPQLVWMILLSSSGLVIVFSYFLYADSEKLKKIYISFLAAIIAMSLFLVYMLDHPFIGTTKISSQPYIAVLDRLTEDTKP